MEIDSEHIRIKAKNRLLFLLKVRGKDDLESALLAKGYIPDEVIERNIDLYKEVRKGEDTWVTELESMTFGTWYYLHPEKVVGNVVPQKSFQMPIKVVGSTKDFKKVFGLYTKSQMEDDNRLKRINNLYIHLGEMVTLREKLGWLPYYLANKYAKREQRLYSENTAKFFGKKSSVLFKDSYLVLFLREKVLGDISLFDSEKRKVNVCCNSYYRKYCLPYLTEEPLLSKLRKITEFILIEKNCFIIPENEISEEEKKEIRNCCIRYGILKEGEVNDTEENLL